MLFLKLVFGIRLTETFVVYILFMILEMTTWIKLAEKAGHLPQI